MKKYINPNLFTVMLVGPNGEIVKIKSKKTKDLPDYFDKYVSRGDLQIVNGGDRKVLRIERKKPELPKPQKIQKPIIDIKKQTNIRRRQAIQRSITKPTKRVVGRQMNEDGSSLYKSAGTYSKSNNIGIGILSYNRPDSLRRLLNSICTYTDINSTTVIVSDDHSTDIRVHEILKEYENKGIVILKNKNRAGIAGNTNRLIQCLSRFKYAILLNDDVEVLRSGWEYLYVNCMKSTGFKHLIHREPGVYGAAKGEKIILDSNVMYKCDDKPQGAILAYDTSIVDTIGYFDESYGLYGMEHVDWSTKVYEFGLQPPGFYDVDRSEKFIKTHKEESSVEDRIELLKLAKAKFASRTSTKCHYSQHNRVEPISYIIPIKVYDRSDSINTVILNIKAQKFPNIEIIVSEYDNIKNVNDASAPFKHILTKSDNDLFNKSKAFNRGVVNATSKKVILHDADIMVVNTYTQDVYDCLNLVQACHLGNKVIYANKDSTDIINSLDKTHSYEPKIERIVGYFEGGSLACTVSKYWAIGGFNEQFEGYGVEDCEFYSRLAHEHFMDLRNHTFLHLWHGRVSGWEAHHEKNKKIGEGIYSKPIEIRIKEQLNRMRLLGYESPNM